MGLDLSCIHSAAIWAEGLHLPNRHFFLLAAMGGEGGFGKGGGFGDKGKGGKDGKGKGKKGKAKKGKKGSDEKEWVPVTKVGRLVKERKIESIEEAV